jgi:hypothetical protein
MQIKVQSSVLVKKFHLRFLMINIPIEFWDEGILAKQKNPIFNVFVEANRAKMASQNGHVVTLAMNVSFPDPHQSRGGSQSPAVRIFSYI